MIRDADGQIVLEEKFFPPNPNALMHILDRIDPQPNLEPAAEVPGASEELSPEAQRAQLLAHIGIAVGGIQVLVDLGVPREQIPLALAVDRMQAQLDAGAIETTATKVDQAEPEPTEGTKPES